MKWAILIISLLVAYEGAAQVATLVRRATAEENSEYWAWRRISRYLQDSNEELA